MSEERDSERLRRVSGKLDDAVRANLGSNLSHERAAYLQRHLIIDGLAAILSHLEGEP